MTNRVSKLVIERIDLWDIWILITAFILVIPDGIGHILPWADVLLYRWGLYAVYVGILFMFAIRIRQVRALSKAFISFLIFIAATLFTLFLNGHGFSAWFSTFSACLFVVLFAEANREHLDKLILSFLIVLEFWIYVNFVLMILIPGGMYYSETHNYYLNWVLGYKSSLQYYILPALCFSWINMKYRNQRVRYFLLLVVSWATTLITQNGMLLIGLVVFTVFQFSRVWKKQILFNIWTYYTVDIAINAVFVFSLTWFANTTLGIQLFLLLGKNATVSRRASVIWPMTIEFIKDHLLFGNGVYSSQARVWLYRGIPGFIHAHNQLMEILFIGGFFLMAFYIILHIQIGKSLTKNRNTAAAKIIAMIIFILYLMMVVEVFTREVAAPIWFILFLGENSLRVHNAFMHRRDCLYSED